MHVQPDGVVSMDEILVGDCTNLPLEDNSVHLFCTSPPYNVGIDYGEGHDDRKELQEYVIFLRGMLREMMRCLVKGGRAAINVAGVNRKPYIDIPASVSVLANGMGFLHRGNVIWDKGGAVARTGCAWGSYCMNSNPVLRDSWEVILMFSKETYDFDGRGLGPPDITKEEFSLYSDSMWRMRPETRCNWHDAPFPEELPYRCIKWLVPREAIVVDPCCGTGTTLYVAKRLYRHWMGFDQNAEYVKRANERLGNNIFEATTW